MYCRHFFGRRFIRVWTVLGSMHLSGHTEVLVSDDQGRFSSGGGGVESGATNIQHSISSQYHVKYKLATNLQTE